MAKSKDLYLESTRCVVARLTSAEAEVFDRLCAESGHTPSAVGSHIIAFVCRSISGLREIQNGDIDSMLADELGDVRTLHTRINDVAARVETATETTRSLIAIVRPAITASVFTPTQKP